MIEQNPRSSSCPQTVDEIVEWFRRTHDPADLRGLVDGMLSKPSPFDGHPATPPRAWRWIIDFGLLYRESKSGWIDRDGKLLSAAYAAHERLLYWLGKDTAEVERAGWARIGPRGWQCGYRLSPRQRRAIRSLGHLLDDGDERLKPIWQENPIVESPEGPTGPVSS